MNYGCTLESDADAYAAGRGMNNGCSPQCKVHQLTYVWWFLLCLLPIMSFSLSLSFPPKTTNIVSIGFPMRSGKANLMLC